MEGTARLNLTTACGYLIGELPLQAPRILSIVESGSLRLCIGAISHGQAGQCYVGNSMAKECLDSRMLSQAVGLLLGSRRSWICISIMKLAVHDGCCYRIGTKEVV